jgi:uncharacterized protein (DUF1501 family)
MSEPITSTDAPERPTPRRVITRRRFITGLGTATTAAVAAGWGLTVWRRSESESSKSALKPGELGGNEGTTLVVVELGGGNDGLNTVVALNDGTYHDVRPTLAVTDPIALDGEIGFHPKLAKLAERYKHGHVAIIEGIGYPDPDLSHFASLANWWAGQPGAGNGAGWIGRYLDGTVGFDEPLAGLSIGPSPSAALRGDKSFATSISDAEGLQPQLPAWVDKRDDLIAAWRRFAPAHVDPKTQLGRVQQAVELTVKARDDLDQALAGYRPSNTKATGDGRRGAAAGQYDNDPIATSLSLAAQLVGSKVAPRVVYVSGTGDFDTHQGEAQRHPSLMASLDAGIETFFSSLEKRGAADRAIVMTVSEFGRRPAENGSGTDHGTAAPHFIIGPRVKGGRYGERPSLTKLDQSANLAHTADFRSLYATVLHGWLGVDPAGVLGKHWETFPVFRT